MSVAHTFLFAVGNSMTTWGKLPQLPGVACDVDKIFDAIVEGGPGLGLADRSRSVKLLDMGAREVKARWEEFIEAVEIDALVVFYFAGHGALVGEHDLRLLLADSDPSRKTESTLPVLQVIQTLENKRVAEWAVILDCCESGEATRDRAIQGVRSKANRGSLIACATSSGSVWETEHGARFTARLTEAIRTGSCMPAGAEFVDISRAATWAKDQLPEPRPLVDLWGSADLWVARILPTQVEIGHVPQSEVPQKDVQRVASSRDVLQALDLPATATVSSDLNITAKRSRVRKLIEPILLENRTIFETYGPMTDDRFNPESELPEFWRRKIQSSILPNNRRLLGILDANRKLMSATERGTLERLRQHIDDFEAKHTGVASPSGGVQFPSEADSLFKDSL